MKSKAPSSKKNILTISFLCLTLAAVIYAMRYANSLPFQSSLEILFNPSGNQSWNWCPTGTQSLVNYQGQELRHDQNLLQAFCTVNLEPAPEVSEQDYRPLLKAISNNRSVTLESNAEMSIFRVEGLPFKSKALTEALKAQLAEFK